MRETKKQKSNLLWNILQVFKKNYYYYFLSNSNSQYTYKFIYSGEWNMKLKHCVLKINQSVIEIENKIELKLKSEKNLYIYII